MPPGVSWVLPSGCPLHPLSCSPPDCVGIVPFSPSALAIQSGKTPPTHHPTRIPCSAESLDAPLLISWLLLTGPVSPVRSLGGGVGRDTSVFGSDAQKMLVQPLCCRLPSPGVYSLMRPSHPHSAPLSHPGNGSGQGHQRPHQAYHTQWMRWPGSPDPTALLLPHYLPVT